MQSDDGQYFSLSLSLSFSLQLLDYRFKHVHGYCKERKMCDVEKAYKYLHWMFARYLWLTTCFEQNVVSYPTECKPLKKDGTS